RMIDKSSYETLYKKFEQAGQAQIFRFWSELSPSEQDALCRRASEIDLDEISRLVETFVSGEQTAKADFEDLTPAPYIPLPARGGDEAKWAEAETAGSEALR